MTSTRDPGCDPGTDLALRVRGASVVLGGRTIVAGVDLDVQHGEVVALLGTNGSGKSTLVRASLGILPLAAGTVTLLGGRLGRATPWRRVGYVPQRMPAATGIPSTAVEVVRAGTLSAGRLWPRSKASALAALESVGLAGRANQPINELSGGQQQRVLIARALVREPELLFLDEPTTGIDLATIDTFVSTLDTLRQRGTAVVVVLHETDAFTDLIDRAVVLRHGRVVHDGPPPRAHHSHAGPDHEHTHQHADPELPHGTLDLTVLGGAE